VVNVDFGALESYLLRVPGVKAPIGKGSNDSGHWWCKFALDIHHALAWNVVQELAHVLNYISIDERLPGVFKPVSPPPYMNGGPRDFLGWVIESTDSEFTPALCAEWLEGRLPRPVEDLSAWLEEGRS
jgi:hypothetical protein